MAQKIYIASIFVSSLIRPCSFFFCFYFNEAFSLSFFWGGGRSALHACKIIFFFNKKMSLQAFFPNETLNQTTHGRQTQTPPPLPERHVYYYLHPSSFKKERYQWFVFGSFVSDKTSRPSKIPPIDFETKQNKKQLLF